MRKPEFHERRPEPEPHPSALRLVPPAVPPAPPASGERPFPGSPPPEEATLLRHLWRCLTDLTTIHTTLQTVEVMDNEAEFLTQFRTLAEEARQDVVQVLTELQGKFRAGLHRFGGVDLARFRTTMTGLCTEGVDARCLDETFRLTLFVPGHDIADKPIRYRYRLMRPRTPDQMQSWRDWVFFYRFLDDALEAVQEELHFMSLPLFETEVYQKFVALTYAAERSRDAPDAYRLPNPWDTA